MTTDQTMIRPTSIEFPFTERPDVRGHVVFEGDDCWAQAQRWLTMSPRPELGYYKTDFTITYADGTTYSGRYDIGADSHTLAQHIRDHLDFHGDEDGFLARYQVGQITTFEVGRTYECRSMADYDCIWRYTVTARTAQTVTLQEVVADIGPDGLVDMPAPGEKARRRKVSTWRGVETCMPHGRYSLAAILSADKAVTVDA